MNVQKIGGNFNHLIAPGIYNSDTRLDVSVSTVCLHHAFTFLYSLNQHVFVTSVKVFVVSKSEYHFLCNQCIFVRQEQSLHNAHGISKCDNISKNVMGN